MSEPPLLTLVIPCYNEQEVFPPLREAVVSLLDALAPDLRTEVILVDDGSLDATWRLIEAFAADDPRVRGIALSRNFGHQQALTCGYDFARGDAVVTLDADLQDPPEAVHRMVARWREGADVVYAVRARREGETLFKRASAAAFYRILRLAGARQVRSDAGDFRLMSRRCLDALRGMKEQHRFLRGMVGWLGFRSAEIVYDRAPRRAGTTKYPLRRMVRFALDATLSFSILPLRLTFLFAGGLTAAILSYLAYVAARYWLYDVALVPGWTSLLLSIMAFGALNLVCLGILGEYVGRIFEEAKGRPLYVVREVAARPDGGPAAPVPRSP
ncbi:MAG: glycosyltransferase family 2 protein [Planctomycetes bacterium]|nr:glycosyltransferase family 2 protein [Planctomycetota bacterium]